MYSNSILHADYPEAPTFPLRIGLVSFLNMFPFINGLALHTPHWEILPSPPPQLAGMLARGQCDLAMVPAYFYLRHRSALGKLDGSCISSDGPCGSVFLLSQVPFEEAEFVEMDRLSMTSNNLARLVVRNYLNLPRLPFIPEKDREVEGSATPVTCVRIGDRAMRMRENYPHSIDLGEAWKQWQGLPFVFAVWATRGSRPWDAVTEYLARVRDWNLKNLHREISEYGKDKPDLNQENSIRYLKDMLEYNLADAQERGLTRFSKLLGI